MSIIERALSKKESVTVSNSVYEDKDDNLVQVLPLLKKMTDGGDHTLLNEYRQIKRPLLLNAFGAQAQGQKNTNLIMVTSAISGEGKTFTTMNLAISIAMERDKTVLMVDCDDARSSLTRALNLSSSPGITDILLGTVSDVEDIIVNTDIDKLKVIPSGEMNAYSTELFASQKMEALLSELAQRYSDRIILFDAPPLLMTSQTKVLAHHVGQVIIVVEEGKTPQRAIVDAISQLDPNLIIGTVLNKRKKSGMGDYYGGFYGQGLTPQ